MFKFPTKPLSSWGVFISGLRLYKNTFSKSWYVFLFYWLTTLYILFGYARGILPLVSFTMPSQIKFVRVPSSTLVVFSLIGILFFLLGLYFKWVALHRIYRLGKQPTSTAADSFITTWKKFWTLFGNYLLISIMMLVVAMPFVIPSIFLGILWLFCAPEILFSGKSVTDAIKESSSLVWGKWWQTFYAILIPLLLLVVPEYNLPYYFVDSSNMAKLFGILISVFLSFVVMPLLWSSVLVKYNDLKLRKARLL